MQQRADGTRDRSDSTIYIREDFSLDKIFALVEKMEKSQNKLGAGFQKYFNQSATGKTDIAFANVFKQYVPYLKSLQGKKASQLSRNEINNLKTFTHLIDKQFRVLSKPMVSQDKLRNTEFADLMRGLWGEFAVAQTDVYTKPYQRNATVLGEAVGGVNEVKPYSKGIIELFQEYRDNANKTWGEHVDDITELFNNLGVTTNVASQIDKVRELIESYMRIKAYKKSQEKKQPYDTRPQTDFSNVSFDTEVFSKFEENMAEFVAKASAFYDKFSIKELLGGLSVITKDLPAIHGLIKVATNANNSFEAGGRIGKMISEAFSLEDVDKKIGEKFESIGGKIGGFVGKLFGGSEGEEAGKEAGVQAMATITKDLGGSIATIGSLVALAVSIIGAIWSRLKKSSPILQAIGDLFDLAMNLFFMPFGNALGETLMPAMMGLIDMAIGWVDFWQDPWGEIIAFFGNLWGELCKFFQPVTDMIDKAGKWILETLSAGWSKVVDIAHTIGNFIFNFYSKIFSGISTVFSKLFTFIYNFYKELIPTIVNAVSTAIKAVGDIMGDVGNNIGNFFDKINPFATGGIINKPTLGLVGEAGPEAIVPLNEAGGIGTTYVININGDVYGVSDLETRIEKVIQRTANKSYYR